MAGRIKREIKLIEKNDKFKEILISDNRLQVKIVDPSVLVDWKIDSEFPFKNNHQISLTLDGEGDSDVDVTIKLDALLSGAETSAFPYLDLLRKGEEWIPVWKFVEILDQLANLLKSISDIKEFFIRVAEEDSRPSLEEADTDKDGFRGVEVTSIELEGKSQAQLDRYITARVNLDRLASCQPGYKGDVVYHLSRQGVLLARHFLDYKSLNPVGWWLSEKYDGYRAIWNGQHFVSRHGNTFSAPKWFTALMPPGIALDGELWSGRGNFRLCALFRKKEPVDSEWIKQKVLYQVYDLLDGTTPRGGELEFEARMQILKRIVDIRCRCKVEVELEGSSIVMECPLVYTPQIRIESQQHLIDTFNYLVKHGAEGVMLRQPHSHYEPTRSSTLLKLKQFIDAECRIVDHILVDGILNEFECSHDRTGKPVKFRLGGLPEEVKTRYQTTHPIGTVVTYTFTSESDGIPNRPMYLRLYDDT